MDVTLILSQGAAAFIVCFGTLIAAGLAYSWKNVGRAFSLMPRLWDPPRLPLKGTIKEITDSAQFVRKEGILALENKIPTLKTPLLKRSLKYLADGLEAPTIREILSAEQEAIVERDSEIVRVYEGAAQAAPAFGMVGAILGLVYALMFLDQPELLGAKISSAFMAMIYGVLLGTLVCSPLAVRLRDYSRQKEQLGEIIKQGVLGIQEGLAPAVLQEKLETYARRGN